MKYDAKRADLGLSVGTSQSVCRPILYRFYYPFYKLYIAIKMMS